MYNLYENKNNIWETENYKFPVAKSTPMEPDGRRSEMIDNVIKKEETDRKNEDAALHVRIDDEITDREEADEMLDEKIQQETNSRIAGDNALDAKITKEIDDRKDSDEILENLISDETTAREAKDEELENRIAAIESGGELNQEQFNNLLAASPYTSKVGELENTDNSLSARITALESAETEITQEKFDSLLTTSPYTAKITEIDNTTESLDTRLTAVEQKETEFPQEKFDELLETSPYKEKTDQLTDTTNLNSQEISNLKSNAVLKNNFKTESANLILDFNNTQLNKTLRAYFTITPYAAFVSNINFTDDTDMDVMPARYVFEMSYEAYQSLLNTIIEFNGAGLGRKNYYFPLFDVTTSKLIDGNMLLSDSGCNIEFTIATQTKYSYLRKLTNSFVVQTN